MAVEVRGMRPEERDDVLDLVGSVMNAPREYFQAIWKHSPGALDEHSRVVFTDGVPVAHQRIYDRRMRLGRTWVRQGGIGDVCTHPDHRRKGYGRMILEDARGYFRDAGYDVAIIFSGVHHFYCSCGYEKCPSVKCRLRTDPGVYERPADFHVRWFEPEGDLEAVSSIYDSYNAARPLSVVRGIDYWRRSLIWSKRDASGGFLVCEPGGAGGGIAAYIRGGPGNVIEVGRTADGKAALAACIGAAMRLAAKRGIEEVSLTIPADEPLLAEIRGAFSVSDEADETTLVQFVNLPQLLAKLSGELTSRLEAAGLSPELRLAFAVGDQEATLVIEDGFVTAEPGLSGTGETGRLEISPREMLVMLALGALPHAELPGGVAPILSALFPPTGGVYWPADIV